MTVRYTGYRLAVYRVTCHAVFITTHTLLEQPQQNRQATNYYIRCSEMLRRSDIGVHCNHCSFQRSCTAVVRPAVLTMSAIIECHRTAHAAT